MAKKICAFLLALCACLLSACGGTEDLHSLETEAQEKIPEYYQARGLLYDERARLAGDGAGL